MTQASNKERFMRIIVREFLDQKMPLLERELKQRTIEHISEWYDYITKQEKERIEKKIIELLI